MSWDWVKILKEEMLDLKPDEHLSRHAATDRLAWVSSQAPARTPVPADSAAPGDAFGPVEAWDRSSPSTPDGGGALLGQELSRPGQEFSHAGEVLPPVTPAATFDPAPPDAMGSLFPTVQPFAAASPYPAAQPLSAAPLPPAVDHFDFAMPTAPPIDHPSAGLPAAHLPPINGFPPPAPVAPPGGGHEPLLPTDQGHVLTLIVDGVLAGVALPTGAEVSVGRERQSTLVVPESKHTVSRRAVTLTRTARRSVQARVENRNGAWVTRQMPEGSRQEFVERGESVTLRVGDRLALDPPGTVVVGLGEPH
jgi:hypothetical protein